VKKKLELRRAVSGPGLNSNLPYFVNITNSVIPRIFLQQFDRFKELGFLPLILSKDISLFSYAKYSRFNPPVTTVNGINNLPVLNSTNKQEASATKARARDRKKIVQIQETINHFYTTHLEKQKHKQIQKQIQEQKQKLTNLVKQTDMDQKQAKLVQMELTVMEKEVYQLKKQIAAKKNSALASIFSIEFNKTFNNLVNAKIIIIGKIRSIKLVELMDKLKEEILIAEKLAALKRVANITDLNLINKKIFRHMNKSKYLKKKILSYLIELKFYKRLKQ